MTSFFDVPKGNAEKRTVKDYITLDYDIPIKVQFLLKSGERAKETYTHWLNNGQKKLPVRCLGYGCPVCSRNQSIDNDKDNPLFVQRDRSYVANVVDLTPAKICPKCSFVNDKTSMKCGGEDCGEKLVDVEPSPLKANRYLEISFTLNERIKEYLEVALENMGVNLKEGEDANEPMSKIVVNIKKYKAGKKTDYMVNPIINSSDAVDPNEYMEKRYDLDKVGIHVDANEMITLMNGGSIKEVMEARKANTESKKSELDEFFGK